MKSYNRIGNSHACFLWQYILSVEKIKMFQDQTFGLYEGIRRTDIPEECVLFLTKNNSIHCHPSPAEVTLFPH